MIPAAQLGEGIAVRLPADAGNLAHVWEQPRFQRLFGELACISRLTLLDKRGTGLSDRPAQLPILETRMEDLRAVLDAVGSTPARRYFGADD